MKKFLFATLFFLVTYVFAYDETPKAFFYDSVKINSDKIPDACKSIEAFQIKSFSIMVVEKAAFYTHHR